MLAPMQTGLTVREKLSSIPLDGRWHIGGLVMVVGGDSLGVGPLKRHVQDMTHEQWQWRALSDK